MILEKLLIRGFGCLKTTVTFSPNRLNLIVADNEMGKSTLVSAILASFYGIKEEELSDDQKRDKRPLLDVVRPWADSKEFGVTMDLQSDGDLLRIERDFNNGSVIVVDLDEKEERTDKFLGEDGKFYIGERLFGLTCEDFLKSFYLKQEELNAFR